MATESEKQKGLVGYFSDPLNAAQSFTSGRDEAIKKYLENAKSYGHLKLYKGISGGVSILPDIAFTAAYAMAGDYDGAAKQAVNGIGSLAGAALGAKLVGAYLAPAGPVAMAIGAGVGAFVGSGAAGIVYDNAATAMGWAGSNIESGLRYSTINYLSPTAGSIALGVSSSAQPYVIDLSSGLQSSFQKYSSNIESGVISFSDYIASPVISLSNWLNSWLDNSSSDQSSSDKLTPAMESFLAEYLERGNQAFLSTKYYALPPFYGLGYTPYLSGDQNTAASGQSTSKTKSEPPTNNSDSAATPLGEAASPQEPREPHPFELAERAEADAAFLDKLVEQAALEAANMFPVDNLSGDKYSPSSASTPDFPLGTSINTLYSGVDLVQTLSDLLSGKRDDLGAYVNVASQGMSLYQGLNTLLGGGKLGETFYDVSGYLGGAASALGLYDTISGLAEGKDINATQIVSSAGQINNLASLAGIDSLGSLGTFSSAAGSFIGLAGSLTALAEGNLDNPLAIAGGVKSAYDAYNTAQVFAGALANYEEMYATALAYGATAESATASAASALAEINPAGLMLGGLELGSRLLGLLLGDPNASFIGAVTESAVNMFGLGGDAHDDARASAMSALTDFQDIAAGNLWGGDAYQSYVDILQEIRQSSGQAAEMGLTAEDVYGYMMSEGMLPVWAPDPYTWHDELRDAPAKYEDEDYMRLDFFGGDDLAESYFHDRPLTYSGPSGVLNLWEERDLSESEQWDAWVGGLSGDQGKLAEGSRAFGAVDMAMPGIMSGLDGSGAGLDNFIAQLTSLADIMPLTTAAEAALNEQSSLMAELWQQGNLETWQLSEGLQGAFAEALATTAASSEMTNGSMSTLVDMLMNGNLGAAAFWQGLTSLADSMGLPVAASQPLIEASLGLAEQLTSGQITTDMFAASLGQIAAGMGMSSENSAAFVAGVLGLVEPLMNGNAAAGSLGLTVQGLAAALGSSAGESSGLAGALGSLGEALAGSSAQAATSGAGIASSLAPALGEAAGQAATAAAAANEMAGAIGAIPTSWDSEIFITRYYQTVGTPFHEGGMVYHGGGQVLHAGGLAGVTRMHHGGWFDDLMKPYEVPAILKRGEYVVKDGSVTGETLPWLAEVNRTGRIPGGAGGDTHLHVNSPLVVVEGGLLGDEETLEDLARLLQGKLSELDGLRSGAAA